MPPNGQKRQPGALEKNFTMNFSYCAKCRIPLGMGALPTPPKHVDSASGDVHVGVVVEIDQTERIDRASGENAEKFLARMMKKYAK